MQSFRASAQLQPVSVHLLDPTGRERMRVLFYWARTISEHRRWLSARSVDKYSSNRIFLVE